MGDGKRGSTPSGAHRPARSSESARRAEASRRDIALTVPASRIDLLRAHALALYVTKADSVHHAGTAYLGDRLSPAELCRHRAELVEVDQVLEQVGWGFLKRPRRATVVADPTLLREIIAASVETAVERIEDAWDEHRDGTAAVGEVRARLRDVEALLKELDELPRRG